MTKKRITYFILFLTISICMAMSSYVYAIYSVGDTKLLETDPPITQITVEPGISTKQFCYSLEEMQLVKDAYLIPLWIRFFAENKTIKFGTYSIKPSTTIKELFDIITSGKQTLIKARFMEGSSFKGWQGTLKRLPDLQHTLTNKTEHEIAILLGLPTKDDKNNPHPVEGWLFPDSYDYFVNYTDIQLLKRAANKMQTNLQKVWDGRDADLPLETPYEMLILASIIEKETAVNSERSQVASVFINRLRKKMKLQTDPTVIYGVTGSYDSVATAKMVREKTAYNTYFIDGLPPTPISSPSLASLEAAAHPAKTDYLFFVANGKGGHVFSADYDSHKKAIRQYVAQLKQNKVDAQNKTQLKIETALNEDNSKNNESITPQNVPSENIEIEIKAEPNTATQFNEI